jgi:hypothetical protein
MLKIYQDILYSNYAFFGLIFDSTIWLCQKLIVTLQRFSHDVHTKHEQQNEYYNEKTIISGTCLYDLRKSPRSSNTQQSHRSGRMLYRSMKLRYQ